LSEDAESNCERKIGSLRAGARVCTDNDKLSDVLKVMNAAAPGTPISDANPAYSNAVIDLAAIGSRGSKTSPTAGSCSGFADCVAAANLVRSWITASILPSRGGHARGPVSQPTAANSSVNMRGGTGILYEPMTKFAATLLTA